MMNKITAWGKHPFQLILFTSAQFVLLTIIAMWVYPGGTKFDPHAPGYTFFHNFFSELGFTVTRSGAPNPIAAPLFFIALTLAGFGLVLFFVLELQFFCQARWPKVLSVLGSICGVVSGLAYVGIAFTPANLFPDPHLQFVLLQKRRKL